MFQTILINPFLNILVYFYNTIAFQDLGLAIIFLTLFIRIVLFPFFYSGEKNRILLQKLQPELKKIQDNHKNDKEKQAQAMMELYKEHDVNPFSGILILFIQLPILIALYRVFLSGLTPEIFDHLYSFVSKPEILNTSLLGLINLTEKNILVVGLAAVVQYIQGQLALPKVKKGQELSSPEKIGRQMVFFSPIITIVILVNFPSAVGLYWLVTGIFSVGQQIYINKMLNIQEEKKIHHLK
ncbi:membrane protein insertase YidC [Candidatus Wolfebacteria bacterium]|nr:membrane protein insertase YidC [Candidatus Wolfebacteria bacterium]